MKQLLDNGTLVTLGLVGVVAAVGAASKAGLYGSRALLSASGLAKLTDAELEDYWESLNPSMRNTEAWKLAVTERNVREYRLPNGPAYAAFKASRRSRGSRALGVAGMSVSVEKDSLSGLWSVHLHDGHRIVNVTGDVFTTKAAADREAKAMLAQARAGVAIDTLGKSFAAANGMSMFWDRYRKPLGGSRALRGSPHAGPSVQRMVDFLQISKGDAAAVKARMNAGAPYQNILEEADRLLNGHGVEYIQSHADTMRSQDGLSYVNMGDTYDTTLLYDHKTGRFSVGSWGDIVERQPRRFE